MRQKTKTEGKIIKHFKYETLRDIIVKTSIEINNEEAKVNNVAVTFKNKHDSPINVYFDVQDIGYLVEAFEDLIEWLNEENYIYEDENDELI